MKKLLKTSLLVALLAVLSASCKKNSDQDQNQSNQAYPAVDNSTTTDNPSVPPENSTDTIPAKDDGSSDTKNGPGYSSGNESGK